MTSTEIVAIQEWVTRLPALSAVSVGLTGLVAMLFAIGMLIFRWRQGSGRILASEALAALGIGALGAQMAAGPGGAWRQIAELIAFGAALVGSFAFGTQRRKQRAPGGLSGGTPR